MSLRLRLALVASALVLGGVALGLTLMYGVIVANSNLTLDRESAILAEVIHEAVLVRGDLGVRVPAVVETYLTDETGVSSAQVYLGGQLLWEGGVLDAPRPLDPVGIVEGKGTRTVAGWRVATLHDPTDGITVQVGRPLAGVRETLAPFASLVVPLTLALTVAAGALAWALAGVALRPLRRLTAAVSRPNGVSVPPIAGRDEPAQLARAYGDLLERLQEQRLRESRFLEYAAHELRTPLSALRASLDAAHGRGGIGPETVGRLRNEARRLEVLAQNLLALSRAEAAELHLDTVDLAALASDAYDASCRWPWRRASGSTRSSRQPWSARTRASSHRRSTTSSTTPSGRRATGASRSARAPRTGRRTSRSRTRARASPRRSRRGWASAWCGPWPRPTRPRWN